jgi:Ser/Thr protein kinase RdoA (MazF antagonist)
MRWLLSTGMSNGQSVVPLPGDKVSSGVLGLAEEERSSNREADFEQLHRRTQVGRLRQLAIVALAEYDLPPARLTLISHFSNTTFRVDTATGQRYVLRIHRTGTPTVETVGAELAWLTALRRDTLLEVPTPIPTRAGSLLTVVSTHNVPRPHICVLFRWMPGRLLHRGLTPRRMERVGELMAHLQNHSAQWERPSGFVRARVDWPVGAARWLPDPFAPEVIQAVETLVAGTLSAVEAGQVTKVLSRVRAVEHELRANEAMHGPAFGLIHADLHYRNLLFARDTVRAIDFDDCGFGPYLYDPAVMLSELLGWAAYPALRAALLAGYRRVRPLQDGHEALLDTFIALRRVQDALWMLELRAQPVLSADWAADARRALAPLSYLLTTR